MNSIRVLSSLRASYFAPTILGTAILSTFVLSCQDNKTTVNKAPVGAFLPVAITMATTSQIGTTFTASACIPGHTISCQTYFSGGAGVAPLAGSGSAAAICNADSTASLTVTALGTFTDICNVAYAFCNDVNTGAALQTPSVCGSGPAFLFEAGEACDTVLFDGC